MIMLDKDVKVPLATSKSTNVPQPAGIVFPMPNATSL